MALCLYHSYFEQNKRNCKSNYGRQQVLISGELLTMFLIKSVWQLGKCVIPTKAAEVLGFMEI